MRSNPIIVTDPLGRTVRLPEALCAGGEEESGEIIYDEYRKVIESPACMIEHTGGRLYYFRSLGWDFTVLIEVAEQDGDWLAVSCRKRPDPAYIGHLLREGKFIAGRSLD